MPRPVTIESMADWLKRHDDFVMIGHVKPDGDAVGSCIAICLALQTLGKRCFVYLSDGVPGVYSKYPYAEKVLSSGAPLPYNPKTAFSLDVSDEDRLGDARQLFEQALYRAMLDHHSTNPGFGDVWHVDGSHCACGELVMSLIDALGVPLSHDMATWLYIAIATDSGQFRYPSANGNTLRCAAKLVDQGIDHAAIARDLWNTRTLSRTRLLGEALSRMSISDDGLMCWSYVTQDMFRMCHASREDTEGIVNYLLEVEGVEFAFLAEEISDGVKFSLRSKKWLDVASTIAAPLGGGGHQNAAGCTIKEPMQAAIQKMCVIGNDALLGSTIEESDT